MQYFFFLSFKSIFFYCLRIIFTLSLSLSHFKLSTQRTYVGSIDPISTASQNIYRSITELGMEYFSYNFLICPFQFLVHLLQSYGLVIYLNHFRRKILTCMLLLFCKVSQNQVFIRGFKLISKIILINYKWIPI